MYLQRCIDFWENEYGGRFPMDYLAIHRYPTGDPNDIEGSVIARWGSGTVSDGWPSIVEIRGCVDDLSYPEIPLLLTEYGVFWGDSDGWNDERRMAFMWHSRRWLEENQDVLNLAGWFWFIGPCRRRSETPTRDGSRSGP